jgi:branched-chain amino acid transport system substrate-binding protein
MRLVFGIGGKGFSGLVLTAFATLAAMVAFACDSKSNTPGGAAGGKGAGGAGGGAAPTAKADPVLVGHFASLTGAQATFGRSTDEGIQLAITEINAAGGVSVAGTKRPLELITEDTESKAEKASTVVNKLVHRDNVVAVLGEVASSISLEGAPVCQKAGIPMITPSSTNTQVTEIGDFIFRVCFIDPFQGWAGAKFAREDLKAAKVALLVDTASAYSQQLAEEFAKAFTSMGGTIAASVEYAAGEKDFTSRLSKIRETSPDLIYLPGYYQDIANISIQLRKLGLKTPMMGGDGWDSEELAKNAGDAIEGCFYTNHYAPDDPAPEIQKFVADYNARFDGRTPDGLAALGYDATRVLAQAIERAGSTEGKAIRDALLATKDFPGVTGRITINAQRNAVKPIVIVERKGGKWVFRARIDDPGAQ